MNIVNRMNRIKALKNQVDILTEQYNSLRDKACSVSGSALGQIRVQKARNLHRMEDMVVQLDALREKILDEEYKLVVVRHEVTSVINQLNDADEICLMFQRYVQLKTWPAIAKDMGMGERNCYRIHNNALKHLQEVYDQPAR